MAQTVVTNAGESGNLVDFLRQISERFGDRQALLIKPSIRYQTWSYQRLWEDSGKVASLLRERGLNAGDRALIWAHNCPQWVVAFFGCMRAGVIVVPIDLRSTLDFAKNVAERTDSKLVFVSRVTPSGWNGLGLSGIDLENLDQLLEDLPPLDGPSPGSDDLAEVMFTSGTTGEPKGVMLSHGNLMSNLGGVAHIVPPAFDDTMLSILPLSHMFEQMAGLLVPLSGGANITYPVSRQPSILFKTMRERRVSKLLLVPQALDLFMKGIEREVRNQGKEGIWNRMLRLSERLPYWARRRLFRRIHKQMGGRLASIFSGGAALESSVAEKWELLGIRVVQGYGATEAAPVITGHPVSKPRYDSAGPPIPGVEVRIASDGEILIRGPNVTAGYWNAPDVTKATFEDDWYKSGDQGVIDENGFLHILGRTKDMIVLASGQNVHPEDIEAELRKHDSVSDAAVVGLLKDGGVEVHAALVLNSAERASEVVSQANSRLAEHQQVRGFTVWPDEDFPRTHTLKVKKPLVIEALTAMEGESEPQEVTEEDDLADEVSGVVRLIAELAQVSITDVSDSLTLSGDLNMDSLRRVELLSAIEAELGVYIDEGDIDTESTVSDLVAKVDEGSSSEVRKSFPRWGMTLWCKFARGTLHRLGMFPLLFVAYRLKVYGRDNLKDLDGPVMFAANHNLHSDNPLIIKSMPWRYRRRLAIAGWDEQWRNPLWALVYPLLGNGFPISKEGAIRPSLENLGRILDDGWSVLIFPEGKLTVGGPMQPFLSGIGLIAIEGDLPVVPIRLKVNRLGFPWRYPFIRRGSVDITFGAPMSFNRNTDYNDATAEIESAIAAL